MTDLDKNVSELKYKIANLEYDVKDAMEQRYMKFAAVSRDAASLLETAQSYSKNINDLLSRINNQVPTCIIRKNVGLTFINVCCIIGSAPVAFVNLLTIVLIIRHPYVGIQRRRFVISNFLLSTYNFVG